MKARIAVFEGYASPFRGAPRRYGAPIFNNPRSSDRRLGGPIFDYPRQGASLGRRGYYVPERPPSDEAPHRRGYRVKPKRNTPAMKKAQARFKKAAKKCSRVRNARRGGFQKCMARALKRKGKR